ncbi:MAG: GNAT family N-acetyltransferase [Epsilonproteobacteria bacterium]|nr:GNAT family N-acetyltransferase [Campylobacterota bacterium]
MSKKLFAFAVLSISLFTSQCKSTVDLKKALVKNEDLFARCMPHLVVPCDGCTVMSCNVGHDDYNYVLHSSFQSTGELAEAVDEVVTFFKDQDAVFYWWVMEDDQPTDIEQVLLDKGFVYDESSYAMFLDLANYEPAEHSGLEIYRIESPDLFRDFCDAKYECGISEHVFSQVFQSGAILTLPEQKNIEWYVGFVGGVPVTTSALAFDGDIVGVYHVATRHGYQRQGLATQMMHFLCQKAKRDGCSFVVLSSTGGAARLYEKIGFEHLFEYKEYCLLEHWVE